MFFSLIVNTEYESKQCMKKLFSYYWFI